MRTRLLVLAFLLMPTVVCAADAVVTQSHTTFDNDDLSVKKGDTVVFSNKDDVTHNIQIVSSDDSIDDKGLQKPGEDIKASFAQAGKYKVRCAIHPKMKMNVNVQ